MFSMWSQQLSDFDNKSLAVDNQFIKYQRRKIISTRRDKPTKEKHKEM